MPFETLVLILLAVCIVLLAVAVFFVAAQRSQLRAQKEQIEDAVEVKLGELSGQLLAGIGTTVQSSAQIQAQAARDNAQLQDRRLSDLTENLGQQQRSMVSAVTDFTGQMDKRVGDLTTQSDRKLESLRVSLEERFASLQKDNQQKLEEMRVTVDEKLQKTLETRLTESFNVVSQRLEQVYQGLGEMRTLASSVGDLKKVLSNVKTRGILGEIQLGAILEQILAPAQYEKNIATKPGSADRVEYAVKLPGEDNSAVYLPIDAKFPLDAYEAFLTAYERGDVVDSDLKGKELERRIRGFAKDIRDKYLNPPETTDFAILFLPVEGLYAEVVRRGLVETLQNEYKVNIAGPTTMAALLNSLQMGFKTLAIQKRSGEVWNILSAVKTEFETFGHVLTAAQSRINQASDEIDKLVGTRTRQIQRRLRSVSMLDDATAQKLLEEGGEEGEEP